MIHRRVARLLFAIAFMLICAVATACSGGGGGGGSNNGVASQGGGGGFQNNATTTAGSSGGSSGGFTSGGFTGGSSAGGNSGGGTAGSGGQTGGGSTAGPSPTASPTPITPPMAARLLAQGTFGPRQSDINSMVAGGNTGAFASWISSQINTPYTSQLTPLQATSDPTSRDNRMAIWWNTVVNGPDQLRQRVAFALSEIFVVSDQNATLAGDASALAYYDDLLARDAFVNFRTLLEDITLSPAMGEYLNMLGNEKPDPANNIRADENYARESMQLFTVGLIKLNLDGTPQLDNNGHTIPTYTQSDVEGLARVYTGWSWNSQDFFSGPPNTLSQMIPFQQYHDTGQKTIIGGVNVPAGATAQADLKIALDTLYNHPNVGPFIGKQLIKKLVTSNPSPAYVARVASVFNNNGQGVRGDMAAVVTAILLDPEARQDPTGSTSFGRRREPLVMLAHLWRAFNADSPSGTYPFNDPEDYFNQAPLSSPTVFNFFSPFFSPPGPIENAGLVAPEFQLLNTNTAATSTDLFADVIFGMDKTNAQNPQPTDILLNEDTLKALAVSNPGSMVDALNLLFMSGQMSADMKQTIVDDISTYDPSSDGGEARVEDAAWLIITSQQYAIQK
jgi:uncharacterized protein (DUF1800 family)